LDAAGGGWMTIAANFSLGQCTWLTMNFGEPKMGEKERKKKKKVFFSKKKKM
jgi:hypothetical protein